MLWAGTRARRGTTHARRPSSQASRRRSARWASLALLLGLVAPVAVDAPAEAFRAHYPNGTATERTCSVHVCVHRATDGPHRATAQWAADALAFTDRAWATIVGELGFPAPAPAPAPDGDPRLHIYVADLGGQHFGHTVIGAAVPGEPRRATSSLAVDNDMAGFDGDVSQNLAATLAHEFFHAVQLNMDASEDRWFMEATATWGETQVFPEIHANRRFLHEGQGARRTVPLDSMQAGYGNYLLLERLAQVAGPDAVRMVWRRLEASRGSRDEWSLEAVAAVLADKGIAWKDFYTNFALANAFPRTHYPARATTRPGRSDLAVTLGPRRPSVEQAVIVPHLSSRLTTLRVNARARKRRVAITVQSSHARATGLALAVVRTDGSLRRVPLKFSRSGTARASVLVKRDKVERLVLITSNASRAYRHCGRDSGWACGGFPRHDRLRVKLTARTTS